MFYRSHVLTFSRSFPSSDTDHYGQNASDRGWACGYRNIQMMSSHLLQRNEDFAKALFDGKGFVPTVPGVQEYLDRAWARGFDPEGAAQVGVHWGGKAGLRA